MYNLDFAHAHKTFGEFERIHPEDPLGPVSDAAAWVFGEFDRLHILQSEFFVNDSVFKRRAKLLPDAYARQQFDRDSARTEQITSATLSRSPQNKEAMFAAILNLGLRADYAALVEKRYLASLKIMKTSRALAEKLVAIDPTYYDAYLAVGVENYLLSLKPAPVRWMLQWGGAQTDKATGIEKLQLTAEKGHYLKPFARLLLAMAALRDKDKDTARIILTDLSRNFPKNRLYAEELAKLE